MEVVQTKGKMDNGKLERRKLLSDPDVQAASSSYDKLTIFLEKHPLGETLSNGISFIKKLPSCLMK